MYNLQIGENIYSLSGVKMLIKKGLIIAVAFAILAGNLFSREINWQRFEEKYPVYAELIQKYSAKYGLEPDMVAAVAAFESSFSAKVSYQGCNGLMQVKGGSFNPEKNINSGCSILRKNLNAFKGNIHHALAAYNQGAGRIRHKIKHHGFKTSSYSRHIVQIIQKIKEKRHGNSSFQQRTLYRAVSYGGIGDSSQISVGDLIDRAKEEQSGSTNWGFGGNGKWRSDEKRLMYEKFRKFIHEQDKRSKRVKRPKIYRHFKVVGDARAIFRVSLL